jgi:hypothetical protein
MGTREQQRAEARAGRVCPVCGGQVEAQRSTARYCSDRCRVADHRRKGVPRKRQGLTRGQRRILAVLSRLTNPIGRYGIAEKLAIEEGKPLNRGRLPLLGHMPELIGHVDAERRGNASLVGLGLVTVHKLDVNGVLETCYTITDKGRKALEAAQSPLTLSPPSEEE